MNGNQVTRKELIKEVKPLLNQYIVYFLIVPSVFALSLFINKTLFLILLAFQLLLLFVMGGRMVRLFLDLAALDVVGSEGVMYSRFFAKGSNKDEDEHLVQIRIGGKLIDFTSFKPIDCEIDKEIFITYMRRSKIILSYRCK
jgi:hypothetical protein